MIRMNIILSKIKNKKNSIIKIALLLFCSYSLILGVNSIIFYQDTYSKFTEIEIPNTWHYFIIILYIITACTLLFLPESILFKKRYLFIFIIILIGIFIQFISPIMYIYYDYEHNIPHTNNKPNISLHPTCSAGG